jgi:hypothetical protein
MSPSQEDLDSDSRVSSGERLAEEVKQFKSKQQQKSQPDKLAGLIDYVDQPQSDSSKMMTFKSTVDAIDQHLPNTFGNLDRR